MGIGAAEAHSDAGGFVASEHDHPEPKEVQDTRAPRYPATVRLDPRRVENVVLKVNARIVNLRDLLPGRRVTRDEVLAEFQSAELETLQRTYIEMHVNVEMQQGITITGEEKLVEGRMNLEWRGMPATSVQLIEDRREPVRRVPIRSPVDGYVVETRVVDGQIVNAGSTSGLFSLSGTTVFRIARDDAVIVEAALPLASSAGVKPGARATLWITARGARPTALRGAVTQVSATVNPRTQRRLVRLMPVAGADAALLRNGAMLHVSLGDDRD